MIFYQAKDTGIEVVHLMHGARDIETLLDTPANMPKPRSPRRPL